MASVICSTCGYAGTSHDPRCPNATALNVANANTGRVIEVDPRIYGAFMSSLAHKAAEGTKQSNPKDALGTAKVPFSTVPANVLAEVAVAMAEGARKYGRHNYRVVGVRSSVYYDAALRHLVAWWEGEDVDPDSGVPHVVKAITTLFVLRDAMLNQNAEDDRPPRSAPFMNACNDRVQRLIEKYPDVVPPYTQWTDG